MKSVGSDSPQVPRESDSVPEEVSALADLLESTGIEVHGQVVQVAASTWIIHGATAYDGETIVGEYSDAGVAVAVWRSTMSREPIAQRQTTPAAASRPRAGA